MADEKFNPHQFSNNYKAGDVLLGEKVLTRLEIYKQLSAPFPEDVVERTTDDRTHKGYDTTGIKYQAIVDRLNDVVTPWGWSYEAKVVKEVQGKTASGKDNYDVTASVTLFVLGQSATHFGSHVSRNYGDAVKGAVTNALKKVAAMFGIGREAYLGTLDDDNTPAVEDKPTRVRTMPLSRTLGSSDWQSCALTNEVRVTPDMRLGVCPVGKSTKGVPYWDIDEEKLKLIIDYTKEKDPTVASIANDVLTVKLVEAALTKLKGKYGNDTKFNDLLAIELKNRHALTLRDLTGYEAQAVLANMLRQNDGLPL